MEGACSERGCRVGDEGCRGGAREVEKEDLRYMEGNECWLSEESGL